MKKLMTSILLGTLVLTSTSMSFAAGNTNIVEKAMVCTKAQPITQIQMTDILDQSGKAMIEIDEATLENLKNGSLNITTDAIALEELPTFEEYMKIFKENIKDINKTDLKSLEKLYNEIATLEKANKFKEAENKWKAFDNILEKYFKDDMNIKIDTINLENLGEAGKIIDGLNVEIDASGKIINLK